MSRQLIQVENKVWSQAEIEQGEKERKEFMQNLKILNNPINKDIRVVKMLQRENLKPTKYLDGAQSRLAQTLKNN